MKNIHVLPTDKPSRLFEDDLQLYYSKDKNRIGSIISNKHIYITSDEEIKRYREYYLDIDTNEVKTLFENMGIYLSNEKKIVLTTDQDLIKDGVEPIPDDFLEWFVKNPSCEEVEIINTFDYIKKGYVSHSGYKIQITKEEAKQGTMSEAIKKVINDKLQEEPKQETLEEVKPPIGKFIIDNAVSIQGTDGAYYHYSEVCKLLRLQQEQDKKMYSEEEMLKMLHKFGFDYTYNYKGEKTIYEWIPEWFEEYKRLEQLNK
jgi:hypothetical protein